MSRRGAGRTARLQSAIPLLVLYFGLAALYAWQASRRPVPTIFTDELELTQLSRAIADTGEPARRGEAYESVATLVAYFLAPVWWLGTASASYATAKLLLVLAMTATIFPAYALARFVVSPWYALAAAGGATAVPALAYSPILVEEPLAYPLSTLALLTIARVLAAPSWGRVGLAVLASAAAALTRTQLAVLFAVLVLGLLWLAWSSEPGRRWRSGVDPLGLDRRRGTRHRCRACLLGVHGPCVDELAQHDGLLQGSDPRPRPRSDGSAGDRDGRAPRPRRDRGARAAEIRAFTTPVRGRSS